MQVKYPAFSREESSMNKIEFLERLEKLLADVPYTERREALNYYTEYFEDADKDEEEVMKTLGTPEEVAANIREEYASKEIVVMDVVDKDGSTADDNRFCDDHTENGTKTETKAKNGKREWEGWEIALVVIVAIVTFPVWGSVLASVASLIIGFVAVVIGIILGLAITGIVLFVVAMIVLGIAFTTILASPLASCFSIGLAIFMIGLSLLCLLASWKSVTVLIPAIFKGISSFFHWICGRKAGAAA